MVSEHTRNIVWDEIRNSGGYVRYFKKIQNKETLKSFWTQGILLFSALGAVASLLEVVPNWVRVVFGLAVAGTVVVSYVCKYTERVIALKYVITNLREVENEWHELWNEIETYRIEEEVVAAKIKNLRIRSEQAGNMYDFGTTKHSIREECWKESQEVRDGRYN